MKRFFLCLLIIALLMVSGCANLFQDNEQDNKQAVNNPVEPSKNNNNENQINNEFSVQFNGKTIALKDWDNEIDLPAILGEPVFENIEELGPGSDTFKGSFVRELNYDGIKLELFSPKDNGKTFYITGMTIKDDSFTTARGIKVGDRVEHLKSTYPDLAVVQDGRNDPNNCAYQYLKEGYSYMVFEVTEGKINEIKIYYEMP